MGEDSGEKGCQVESRKWGAVFQVTPWFRVGGGRDEANLFLPSGPNARSRGLQAPASQSLEAENRTEGPSGMGVGVCVRVLRGCGGPVFGFDY